MIAEVTIQTAFRDGRTILQHCYNTPPFKVADITENKRTGGLQLMLMSSSPGILDGDRYTLTITVNPYCRLQLHTQAYQRLFRMKSGARQMMQVQVQQSASFTFLPHPTVPHEGSIFSTHNKFFLQPDSRLICGEVLTCGRTLNGERFHFSRYHSITEIFLEGRLIIKENLLLEPAGTDIYAIGQWENYTHQANLICYDESVDRDACTAAIHGYLSKQETIASGVSSTAGNGIIVRLLGYKAEQLYDCLQMIAAMIPATPTGNLTLASHDY